MEKEAVGFFDVERFGVALTDELEREVIDAVNDPGIAGFAGEKRELADRDDASIMIGGSAGDIADLLGKTKACAINHALAWGAFAC